MLPRNENPVTRAAFIAERADGTRMLYELAPSSVEFEIDHYYDRCLLSPDWITRAERSNVHLTARGIALRGVEFHGDMPTVAQTEITNRHELEPGRHQITRGTHAG